MLSDPLRVRVLRLLAMHELGVGELARILQLPQSTVSRHLKPLFDRGWVTKRAEGTTSLYRHDAGSLGADLAHVWSITRARLESTPTVVEDDHRLTQVLADRRADSTQFFGRIGGEWSTVRSELFGSSITDGALLGLLDPEWVVADIGCGTGEATQCLAPVVSRVIAIDREPTMLRAARQRLAAARNVEFRAGDIGKLPLADGEVDAAVVMLVVHHVDDPRAALTEIARALRPGGALLVVDMAAHDREHWRHTMGHRHLGFTADAIAAWDGSGGLRLRRVTRLRPDIDANGPGLFAALLRKP